MSLFDIRKKDCLARKDRSNKQSIDKDIKPLINFLNSQKDYYTTSSCSGRILLIEKITEKKKDIRFVFAEHKKADFKEIKNSLKKLNLYQKEVVGGELNLRSKFMASNGRVGRREPKTKNDIWFKQESIIIHICCRNIDAAEKLLKIVRDLGIKRAGIIHIGERIVLEIIGTESMETIIAKDGKMVIDENYLKTLVQEANKKLDKNKRRIKELNKKIMLSFS